MREREVKVAGRRKWLEVTVWFVVVRSAALSKFRSEKSKGNHKGGVVFLQKPKRGTSKT